MIMNSQDIKFEEQLNSLLDRFDETSKNRFINNESMIKDMVNIVNRDLNSANSEQDVKRIEMYMEWIQEWGKWLNEKKAITVIYGMANVMREAQNKLNEVFSEEGIQRQYEKLMEDVEKKSKEYNY